MAVLLPLRLVSAATIASPIKVSSISELIQKIIDILVQIGIPIAALFIVWSGFLFVTAHGNDKQLEDAKKTFWMTILGSAILLGAKVIADTLAETIKSL